MRGGAALPASLVVALVSLPLTGQAVAVAVDSTYCRDCPCSGAPERMARLRTRLDELATSSETLTQRVDELEDRIRETADRMRGDGGSLGNFSERLGGVADTREALSNARTDGLGDLITLLDQWDAANAATEALGEAVKPLQLDLQDLDHDVQQARRWRKQLDAIERERKKLQEELDGLEAKCGSGSGPSRRKETGAGGSSPGSTGGGGGGGGRGGRDAASGPGGSTAPGVPSDRDIRRMLGALTSLRRSVGEVRAAVDRARPKLEALARSAQATDDPRRQARIAARVRPDLGIVRGKLDGPISLARSILEGLGPPGR